jgi:hypothetical protein
VLITPSKPEQPACPAGIAGITNVVSTTVAMPVALLYGTPPVFPVERLSDNGPSGQAVIPNDVIARLTEIEPLNVA